MVIVPLVQLAGALESESTQAMDPYNTMHVGFRYFPHIFRKRPDQFG